MQDALAILTVALAAAFLARRGWRHYLRRAAGACGSCGSCPASASTPQPLVSISPLVSHAQAQRHKAETTER